MNIHHRLARVVLGATATLGLGIVTMANAPTASAAAKVCISGALKYDHIDAEAGTALPRRTSPSRGTDWKLYDKAVTAGAVPVAKGRTSLSSGSFNACYVPATARAADLYIRFEASSAGVARVVAKLSAPKAAYSFTTKVARVSASRSIGTVKPPAASGPAWKIADTLNLLWAKRGNPSTNCWTVNEANGHCTPMTFVWPVADTGYFDFGDTDFVLLERADANSKHTILHEAGHYFQFMLHDRDLPEVDSCSPHYVELASSTSCAWTEGFADAVAAYVLRDSRYVYSDGDVSTLVAGPGAAGWDEGDEVQGHVAAALLGLWSAAGPDGGDWNDSIEALVESMPADFADYFFNARPLVGLSTDEATLQLLAAQTIYY